MKKGKNIVTPQLLIDGNIMAWEDSVLQLSNVSSVSTVPIESLPFPSWTLAAFLLGIVMVTVDLPWVWAAILMAAALFGILYWYQKNETLKMQKNLLVLMNSGITFSFLFNNQEFLDKVFNVLSSIIAEGGGKERHVEININNSTISGDAKVLNNINL